MTEQIKCKQLFLIILISLFTTLIHAGTTGKLAGKISDIEGNPIPFANIVLRQNGVNVAGGQSKENGTFFIINIPPGIHEMRITHEVYHPAKVTGLIIPLDETSVQNVELVRSSVKIEGFEGFVVTKATNLKDTIMSLDEFDHDSPQSIDDAISLVAGVESNNGEIHVRGGRSNKVAYKDDGLSVSAPIDGASSLQIDMDAVQVMGVQTGGSTAGEHIRQKKAKYHNVDKRHIGRGTTMSLDELEKSSVESIDEAYSIMISPMPETKKIHYWSGSSKEIYNIKDGIPVNHPEPNISALRYDLEAVQMIGGFEPGCFSKVYRKSQDSPKPAVKLAHDNALSTRRQNNEKSGNIITGKLAGKVVDREKSIVPFANIEIIQDSVVVKSAKTKENGSFFIINILTGTYDMRITQPAYHPLTITDLRIEKDETVLQNVVMTKYTTLVEGKLSKKATNIKFDRPKRGKGTTMSLEELEESSVESIDDAITLVEVDSTYSYSGSHHVRGNNVVFTMDGVYVDDDYDLYEGFSLICNNPETGTNVTRAEMTQINENLNQKPTMILDTLRSSDNIDVNDSILSFFVLDRASHTPIKSAKVFLTIDGIQYGVELSDESGNTKFNRIPSGVYEVLVEAEGYCTNKKIIPAQNSGAWVTGIELDKLNY